MHPALQLYKLSYITQSREEEEKEVCAYFSSDKNLKFNIEISDTDENLPDDDVLVAIQELFDFLNLGDFEYVGDGDDTFIVTVAEEKKKTFKKLTEKIEEKIKYIEKWENL